MIPPTNFPNTKTHKLIRVRDDLLGWLKLVFSSIRNRLTLVLIAFALIPVLIISNVASKSAENAVLRRTQNNLSAIAALKGNRVQGWTEELFTELNAEIESDAERHWLLFLLQSDSNSPEFRNIHNSQLGILNDSITGQGLFEELFLLNQQGNVILSTDKSQEGKNYSSSGFFQNGLIKSYLQPPTIEPSIGHQTVIAASPLTADQGEVIGILAGRANLDNLSKVFTEKTGLGKTSEIYLVGSNGILLTPINSPELHVEKSLIHSSGITTALQNLPNDSMEYSNYQGIPVIGSYYWLPNLQAVILAEIYKSEVLESAREAQVLTILIVIGSIILTIIAAFIISRTLTQPLTELTQIAGQIADGNLNIRAATDRKDETGPIAVVLNDMTAQVQNLSGTLEEHVTERTHQLQSKNEQLISAMDVSKSLISTSNTREMIQQVVELIQQRLNLYFVGLYLIDDKQKYAVLKAGTGQDGLAMVKRGHRIRIEERSMVGWSIVNNQAQVLLEAEQESSRLNTHELPVTLSEASISLRSGGQVLGAFYFQSSDPGTFDEEMITVLQTISDQVALVLDNSRLYSEIQQSIVIDLKKYSKTTHMSWLEKLCALPVGNQLDSIGLIPAKALDQGNEGWVKKVPIKIHGRTIGYINTQKCSEKRSEIDKQPFEETTGEISNFDQDIEIWKPEELASLETLANQMGDRLDSVRFIESTHHSPERERLISEVSNRIRASLDVQTVIQTAVKEIRDALRLQEVELRIGMGENPDKDHTRDMHNE